MKEFVKLVFKFTFIMMVVIGIVLGAVIVYAKMSGKELTDFSSILKIEVKGSSQVEIF